MYTKIKIANHQNVLIAVSDLFVLASSSEAAGGSTWHAA